MKKNQPKDSPAENPPATRLADLREATRDLEHLLSDVRAAAEDGDLDEVKTLLDSYFEEGEEEENE